MSTTTQRDAAAEKLAAEIDPRLHRAPTSPRELWGLVRARLRAGELGAWPVIIGLLVIWAVFQSLTHGDFLTAQNLSNLTLQIAAVAVISVGVVLVLLLGEIDLSVGSVAGAGAAALAVLNIRHGVPDLLAIVLVIAMGALIGFVQGAIFAKIGVPSFIVTLGGNIGWLGLQLWLLSPQGTVNFPYDGLIGRITHTTLTDASGWALGAVVIAGYVASVVVDRRRRLAVGLPVRSPVGMGVRIAGLTLVVAATVALLNAWQGVPWAFVIVVGLVIAFDLLLRRTRYGRGVFAVGGNIEAARRAGLRVDRVRISVFAIAGALAALGGILFASRNFAASQSTAGGDVLMIAIAGAVIGGTSLFGGRGTTYSALLGGLVLGSITSGMLLLSVDTSVRYMITAAVLVGAVILDSLSRRGRRASGRE